MIQCQGITLAGVRCKKSCKDTHCWIHKELGTCGICLDNLNTSIKLDCGHSFCEKCIKEWICVSDNYDCPNCRMSVSENERHQAFDWGIEHYILVYAHNFTVNLSQFDLDFQETFMMLTGFSKYQTVTSEEMLIIKGKIRVFEGFSEKWNTMCTSMPFSKKLLINESKIQQKNICYFTFI